MAPLNQRAQYSDSLDSLDNVRLSPRNGDEEEQDDPVDHADQLDQLPSVEQIRANGYLDNNGGGGTHSPSIWSWWRFRIGLIVGMILFLVGIAVGFSKKQAIATTSQTQEAGEFLSSLDISISDPDTFSNPSSPQSQALKWMLTTDPADLGVPSDVNDPFLQRYIAAVFLFTLIPNPLGVQDIPFLQADHECHWQADFHRPDQSTLVMGFLCNDSLEITDIVFQTMGLKGQVPSELAHLPKLEKLLLDVNMITGDIPVIPSLTHLSLGLNMLDGTLPPFDTMTNLQVLALSENMLQGSLPESMSKLTQLQVLGLGGNELTGEITPIYVMLKLQELYLDFNSFSATLDNSSFFRLSNLRVLDLNNNKLSGPLPDVLWNLTKLEVVDVHFNALGGRIHAVEITHPLQYLDVSSNILVGGLPPSMDKFAKLTHLDVTSNRFDDLLPTTLGALSNMKTLLLGDNNMFGPQPIPDWLQHMTHLKHLSLQATSRTGAIPDWFATSLEHLSMVDLGWNHLDGTLSTTLGQLRDLEYLLLNRNRFEGSVPTFVSSGLKILLVDNNKFVGELSEADFCEVSVLIADCGNPNEGCPNCTSDTQEIACPCCTSCCYDEAEEACNARDWLEDITKDWVDDYSRGDYIVTDETAFEPVNN
jgi:Leucine-rich repeat (LRR) protein